MNLILPSQPPRKPISHCTLFSCYSEGIHTEKLLDVRYLRRKTFSVNRSPCDTQYYLLLQTKHSNSPSYTWTHPYSIDSTFEGDAGEDSIPSAAFRFWLLHSILAPGSNPAILSICFGVVFLFSFFWEIHFAFQKSKLYMLLCFRNG